MGKGGGMMKHGKKVNRIVFGNGGELTSCENFPLVYQQDGDEGWVVMWDMSSAQDVAHYNVKYLSEIWWES